MAENKKGFILYSDIQSMIDKLPDEYAGKLFKFVLAYVNDEEPTTDDIILQIAFEPIKQSLKRDLNKWNDKINKRSEAGKIGANVRWQKQAIANDSKRIKPMAKIADSVNVNVSVNDNEKDIYIYSFFNSLIDYGFNKNLVNDWIQVRKSKKLTNTKTAFDKFIIEVEKCKLDKNEILKTCVEKSWGGFNSNWIEEEKPVYESSDDALYRNVMASIAKTEALKNGKNVN